MGIIRDTVLAPRTSKRPPRDAFVALLETLLHDGLVRGPAAVVVGSLAGFDPYVWRDDGTFGGAPRRRGAGTVRVRYAGDASTALLAALPDERDYDRYDVCVRFRSLDDANEQVRTIYRWEGYECFVGVCSFREPERVSLRAGAQGPSRSGGVRCWLRIVGKFAPYANDALACAAVRDALARHWGEGLRGATTTDAD